jgi:mono/diheme cytochrome c family protein
VVDRIGQSEVQTVTLHNPEPQSVVDGRPFLYDARLTSSNGESSCSSCHIFGDMDDLGWDLGNPDDNVKTNTNAFNDGPFQAQFGFGSCTIQSALFGGTGCNFHPMKGPMTTQSLRGLDGQGPQHWRGDRLGNANSSFNAFNVAFPGLVGRASTLPAQDMQKFTDFALQLRYPPNPVRALDNSLTAAQQNGADLFDLDPTDAVTSCNGCHVLDPPNGFFGGAGLSTFDAEAQVFKVPHLRNAYQKVGMFGLAPADAANVPVIGNVTPFDGSATHLGDQIRGFGYTHDGSVDTLFHFVSAGVFDLTNNEQRDIEEFLIAFDTDLAPIVGQQVTLTSSNSGVAGPRINLMIQRANTSFASKVLVDINGGPVNECELIAKLVDGGAARGYLYNGSTFDPDDGGAAISDAALRNKAASAGQEITYTCVPPGSGHRMAIDRDGDGLGNGVETGTGIFVNANDTGTRADKVDTDDDGFDDPTEVGAGTDPNNALSYPGAPAVPVFSPWAVLVLAGGLSAGGWQMIRRRRVAG